MEILVAFLVLFLFFFFPGNISLWLSGVSDPSVHIQRNVLDQSQVPYSMLGCDVGAQSNTLNL